MDNTVDINRNLVPGKSTELLPFRETVPPVPPALDAFYGLAGDVVRAISPYSETNEVAILSSYLAGMGNMIGRTAHFTAEGDEHYGNLFITLVGGTAKARKGSSWGQANRLLLAVDEKWNNNQVASLSSGEGIVAAVAGAGSDKRLMIIEQEFASLLKVMTRKGNTIGPILRNAWDGKPLQALTKHNPLRADDAHISMLGHVTKDELQRALAQTEKASGFANRFLWFYIFRSKLLPEPEPVPQELFSRLVQLTTDVLAWVDSEKMLITKDPEAKKLWHEVYPSLSREEPGLIGAITARAEPQVMRLAMLYAVLDKSRCIGIKHLKAALALWEYAYQSVQYIFGTGGGCGVLESEILNALESGPLQQTKIYKLFSGNVPKLQYTTALRNLFQQGLITYHKESSGRGRPAIIWEKLE